MFQSLEQRFLLAGNVVVRAEYGWIVLEGDAAANSILIERSADDPSLLLIRGQDGTTLNGAADDVPFTNLGLRNRFRTRIGLGEGDDMLALHNLQGVEFAEVSLGAGNDQLTVQDATFADHVSVDAGIGDDQIAIERAELDSWLMLNGGAGRDTLAMGQTRLSGNLIFNDRSGRTTITLEELELEKLARITTGNAADSLIITDSTFAGRTTVFTAGGDDYIKVRGTTFPQPTAFNDGDGNDTVDRELILTWDFRDGPQGWKAGFADYRDLGPSRPLGSGVLIGNEIYWMKSGPRQLDSGASYMLSSNNVSDDIFMFLSKALFLADGIVAGMQYQIGFDLKFVASVPAGLPGIGGMPANSVYLKAGASPRKPVPYAADSTSTPMILLNVDYGNQAAGGREMSVVGDIRNGLDQIGAVEVRRRHTHEIPVRADSLGRLWIMVGTDSGYEGRTTLYYTRLSVKITPVMI